MKKFIPKPTTGLLPLKCDNPEILILGSFPGIGSLESREYYHEDNNKNLIWEVICEIYNDYPVPQIDEYDKKKALLARHRIVLWDYYEWVIRNAEDSSDKSICIGQHNDIIDFLKKYPTINKIAINGYGKYDSWGKKLIKAIANDPVLKSRNIQVFRLPETSGLNTRYNVEQLAKEWEAII
jgi:TDG/mug DNA glycosylase family protein